MKDKKNAGRRVVSVIFAAAVVMIGVLFTGVTTAHANPPAEVYVSAEDGSDGYSGTSQNWPFATIQKGIDEVADGGTVHVDAGTYEEDLDVQGTTGLTLLGAQAGVSAGPGAGRNADSTEDETIVVGKIHFGGGTPTVSDLTIDGFRLENTALTNNGARINGELVITNTIAHSVTTYFLISVGTGSGHSLELTNSNITGARGFSVENANVTSAMIANNVFNTVSASLLSASADDGVLTLSGNVFNSPRGFNLLTNDNLITGNVFNTPAGADNRGMDMYEVTGNTITDNTFSGDALGIRVRPGARGEEDVSDNTLENNSFGEDSFRNDLDYVLIFGSNTVDGVVLGNVFVKASSSTVAELDGDFYYWVTDDEAMVVDYIGTDEAVGIPLTLGDEDYPVTGIWADAFREKELTSVSIPYSVVEIGARAFKDNELTSVWIPDGVAELGEEAFAGNNLIYVNVPESLTEIAFRTFAENELELMTVTEGIEKIGAEAFMDNNLASITIPAGVTEIGSNALAGNQANPADLTIYGAVGSEANVYATAEGHTFGRIMHPDPDDPAEWESHAAFLSTEFENSMTLFVEVEDDEGEPIDAPGSSLAVFKGSEIRGWGEIDEFVPGYWLFMFLVWSNEAEEEGLDFRVFDADSGEVYGAIDRDLDFEKDASFGTAYDDTEILAVLGEEEDLPGTQTVNVEAGWNWITFDTLPEDRSINSVLQGYEGTSGDIIRTADGSATYYHDGNWYGTLGEIDFGTGYQLYAQSGSTLVVEGTEVDEGVEPIQLAAGWNWIGYYGSQPASLADALGTDYSTGDIIKGEKGFAAFDGTNKLWYGPLTELEPGKAYMLKVAAPGELEFDID